MNRLCVMNKQSAKPDPLTFTNVFIAATFNAETRLWIGVSDVGEENYFTYLSDGTLVNWVCETSEDGRAGTACFINL